MRYVVARGERNSTLSSWSLKDEAEAGRSPDCKSKRNSQGREAAAPCAHDGRDTAEALRATRKMSPERSICFRIPGAAVSTRTGSLPKCPHGETKEVIIV